MEDSHPKRVMRRHLAATKRIRALDPKRDSAEFAEGRLRDFAERIRELERLRDTAPEDIPTLQGLISVSQKLLALRARQFDLSIYYGADDPEDPLGEGGAGVPAPVTGPLILSGCGGRTFAEAEECNDW